MMGDRQIKKISHSCRTGRAIIMFLTASHWASYWT